MSPNSVTSWGAEATVLCTEITAAQTPHQQPAVAFSRPHIRVLALPDSVTIHAVSQHVQHFNASHINKLSGLYMDLTFSIFQVWLTGYSSSSLACNLSNLDRSELAHRQRRTAERAKS